MRPTTNFTLHAILAAALAALAASGTAAADPAYIKFGGVEGDTEASSDKPRIAVIEWSWGETRSKKKGNVEYTWKVEEGENAPPAPGEAEITLKGDPAAPPKATPPTVTLKRGTSAPAAPSGVTVAAGDVTGDGTAAPRKPTTSRATITPRSLPGSGSGSLRVKVKMPWLACEQGRTYPSLELWDGAQHYQLSDVSVTDCAAESISFSYARVKYNNSPPSDAKVRGWDPEKKESITGQAEPR